MPTSSDDLPSPDDELVRFRLTVGEEFWSLWTLQLLTDLRESGVEFTIPEGLSWDELKRLKR